MKHYIRKEIPKPKTAMQITLPVKVDGVHIDDRSKKENPELGFVLARSSEDSPPLVYHSGSSELDVKT